MKKELTLKSLFTLLFAAGALLAILLLASLIQVSRMQSHLSDVHNARYNSYLLADELRQSSDDLTRLARTYVVTGDAKYEQQYMDILDIRNGKKPRPQHYERIYWDFVAAGNAKPRPDGATVSLQDLMKKAGFSDQEFSKLKEAQANSDALVNTEVIAMNAVKGLFDDGNGKFTKQGEPDLEMARKLMHSDDYHQFKARIMKPVDDFLALLDSRTGDAVEQAIRSSHDAYLTAVGVLGLALLAAIAALLFVHRRIFARLGGEPVYAQGVVEQIAAGDLNVDIALRGNDHSSLLFAMKGMRDSFAGIVGQVRSGTDTIAHTSSGLADGNRDLSQRTEQQAEALEKTASSMEELTATVKQNSDNARQANQLAASASDVAVKGGSVVSQVVQTMGSINASSSKIVDIIGVIDGIAFQTNILALNAAVEAARAGEQGRGFAVVASEVRNLAQRSAAAAKEIKVLISDSVEKVDAGSKLVNQAGSTMDEIVASVKRVTDIMAEISAAGREQEAGIGQISEAINEMDQVTQKNAALVEHAAAAAESMQDQAASLKEVVSVFKLNGTTVAIGAPARSMAPPPKRLAPVAKRIAAPKAVAKEEWEQF